jgi:cell division septation protein DedD
MRRMHRIVLLAGMVALAPVLAGCADFDMDKLDFFHLNEKKKLPGERKEVFPGGVPGVSQGIPPEYLKGNQPPPDVAQTSASEPANIAATTPDDKAAAPAQAGKTAAVEPAEEPKPKAKPKPKRKPKPRTATRAPTQVTVKPAAQKQTQGQTQAQGDGQQQLAPWPGAEAQQPTSGQNTGTAPWPSAPAPGTFSR